MVGKSGLLLLLEELTSKKQPQWLYRYKVPPLLRFGSIGLSAVLMVYSLTFTDMTWFSAQKRKEEDEKEGKHRDWVHLIKVYGPLGMALLPFTLSLATLWTFSRLVTGVQFIPKGQTGEPAFKVVRNSAVLGRSREKYIPITNLVKTKQTRIYTGKGHQGIEDKGTFCFYLRDTSMEGTRFWDRHYILSRAGILWKSDGKLLEALFNRDKKLEEGTQSSLLNNMVRLNKDKHTFHSSSKKQSEMIKDIILNTKQE